jgi:hypothetical protein
MIFCRATLAVALSLAPAAAFAQEVAPVAASVEAAQPTAPVLPPAAAVNTVPAGTEILVEIVTPLSSRTSTVGQIIELRLVEPVMAGDQIAIPAGTTGAGEVIDAAPAGLGGRPGKLVVSGRHLELNGTRIRIRGMTMNLGGERMTNTSTAVSLMPVVGVIGPFIQGGNIEIPAGTRAQARIAVATTVAPAAPSEPAQTPAEVPAAEPTLEGQQ